MYPQERPDGRHCAICKKVQCACGCEFWVDEDGGTWTPVKWPVWLIASVWFAAGFVCGATLAAKHMAGN